MSFLTFKEVDTIRGKIIFEFKVFKFKYQMSIKRIKYQDLLVGLQNMNCAF